jgi:hypothetical protein
MSGGASRGTPAGHRRTQAGVLVVRLWCDDDDPEPRARITARLDLTGGGSEATLTARGTDAILRAIADELARFATGPSA